MIKRTKALLPKLAFMEFQQCVFWRRSLLRYFSSSAHVEISPLLRFTSERNRDECSVYIPVKILGFISWILNIWRLSSWISSVKSLQSPFLLLCKPKLASLPIRWDMCRITKIFPIPISFSWRCHHWQSLLFSVLQQVFLLRSGRRWYVWAFCQAQHNGANPWRWDLSSPVSPHFTGHISIHVPGNV